MHTYLLVSLYINSNNNTNFFMKCSLYHYLLINSNNYLLSVMSYIYFLIKKQTLMSRKVQRERVEDKGNGRSTTNLKKHSVFFKG